MTVLPAGLPPDDATTTAAVSPVRTLRGHTRSISATGMISRGRNILSCAKDGTVRLWDVSTARQLHLLVAGKGKYTPVMSMTVGQRVDTQVNGLVNDAESHGTASVQDGEVDTSDKVVYCALGDGTFEGFDLRTKASFFQSEAAVHATESRAALKSIVYSSSRRLLATGSVQGTVTLFDVRSLSQPLTSFYRNSASIEDLAFCPPRSPSDTGDSMTSSGTGLIVATEDGLPYIAEVNPSGAKVRAEIVGGDCDAVRVVRVDEKGSIWTASDDGVVRKYSA